MKVEISLSENEEVLIYSPTSDWEIVCAKDGFFYVYEYSESSGERLYVAVKSLKDAYDAVRELI